jgi:alpha-galactosidase
MLEIGNGAFSLIESKTHFALWSIMKAPLILGNDLTKMDADTLAIISNK